MELTLVIWIVLLIVLFILGLILGDRTRFPSRIMNSMQAKTEPAVLETKKIPAEGGTFRFIDTSNQIDLQVTVPRQTNPRPLIFERFTPIEGLANPTGKTIYKDFMGLAVTDENRKPVTYFDPAITITKTYSSKLLSEYMEKFKVNKDLSNLALAFHDGVAWIRLPITDRNPSAGTLTALIGSFAKSDNLADCG